MARRMLCAAVLAGALAAAPAEGGSVSAPELMAKNFLATKVSAFNGAVSMVLTTAQGQERVRKLLMWSRLEGKSTDTEVLMRFDAPGDIKGTGFLQVEHSAGDDDIWVFLPALGKTRRLVANAKRDSFFGTDFSYGDVLLPPVNRYQHTYLRSEKLDGDPCDVIESKPADAKTRDESGYSRKVTWLDAATHVERKVEYYDLGGNLLKTQRAFDIKQVESSPPRWTPMRREMVNHQTGHKTIYRFDRFVIDPALTESYFSTRTLERM